MAQTQIEKELHIMNGLLKEIRDILRKEYRVKQEERIKEYFALQQAINVRKENPDERTEE